MNHTTDPRGHARANAEAARLRCDRAEVFRKEAYKIEQEAKLLRASVAAAPNSIDAFVRLAEADTLHARAAELYEKARRLTASAYEAMTKAYTILKDAPSSPR